MATVSVKLLSDNTRQAREMALDGDYDSACIFYSGVLQQVQKLMASIGDSGSQSKWTMVSVQCQQLPRTSSHHLPAISDPEPDQEGV